MAVVEVVLPMLGITIEKGKILKWIKKEGEFVSKSEPIFEVETDKVVTEVESPGTGVLKKVLVSENIEVPILTLVGVITDKGEELPAKYQSAQTAGARAESIPAKPSERAVEPESQKHPGRARSGEGFDLAVVGAGPGGYVAAIRAAQLGARVLVIEKGEIGGTCLNRGCIPTKSFLSDVQVLRKVRSSDLFKNGSSVSIDIDKMVTRKEKVVETMKRGISLLFESRNITFIRGAARFLDPKGIEVTSAGKKTVYHPGHVVIATGSKMASLPGANVDHKRVVTSDDLVHLTDVPKEILIIGGGVIGVEFACVLNGLGSKVAVIEMLPKIVATEDEEVIRGLQALLERQGIRILTGTKVLKTAVKGDHVQLTIEQDGKEQTVDAEKVLQAVGRIPETEGLDVEKIGLQMEKRAIRVNSRMETNVEGVYAIGDVIGGMMLAHAASAEGIAAVENIMGKAKEVDYLKVPSCIYTFPEVASVGLKEEGAKLKGFDVEVGRFPYLNNGKALATGESDGFVKIVAEKRLGRILGVHILGEHATDLIGECLLAMNVEASVEDLGEVIKGHPTLSEAVMEAGLDWEKRAIHLPRSRT